MSVKNKVKKNYNDFLNKYLNSVQYTFDKGAQSSKKVSIILNNIPEINSKRLIQYTLILLVLVLIIFLASCQTNNYGRRVGYATLPVADPTPRYQKTVPGVVDTGNKSQEQLYVKRNTLNIREKESGSSSGSIWADSAKPKSLVTEFKPTRAGDILTVNIPDDLQYKSEQNSQTNNAGNSQQASKPEPVKSFKFQVVGIEPGGDVYLRGTKNYTSDSGEQRNIMVMAKLPRRSMNNSQLSASELTEVAVNENINGMSSDYSSIGWDQTVSKKVSGYTPDMNSQMSSIASEKKEIETQRKALVDQQKSLKDREERLKKDRQRLDVQTAQAKGLLDSAKIIDMPKGQGSSGGGQQTASTQSNNGQK